MQGTKAIWIVLAVAVVAASFLIGYGAGVSKNGQTPITVRTYDSGFAAGMAEARKKLEDSGMFPNTLGKVTSLSGTVKSIDGGKMILTVSGRVSPNPLDDQGPTERTVTISDQTKITSQTMLTPEELAASIKKYQADAAAGKPGTPPPSFIQKTLLPSDIKAGQYLTVNAADDIRTAAAFDATDINLSVQPNVSALSPLVPTPAITLPIGTMPVAPKPIEPSAALK